MRSFATTALAALALLAVAGAPAAAQIVNTQPLLSKLSGEGFAGELRGSLDWRTGNIELVRVKSTLLARFRHGDQTLISSSKLDIGLSGGKEFVSQVFSHLRYQLALSDLVTWEVFGQVSTAKFKRLTVRELAGTGPRWHLYTGAAGALSLGTAYMFEHERLNDGDFADSGRADHNHRLSLYLAARWAPSKRVTFIHTTFCQPRIDALSEDVRVYSDTTLALKLDDGLAFTVGFLLAYDSGPPVGVDDLDTDLDLGLAFTF